MIRIITVDPRPAVLAGVEAILRERPGIAHVGSAQDRYALWPLLQRTHPDVVLLDHTPGGDGLELCLRLTDRRLAPRVVLHVEDTGPALVPAAFAGADGLIGRTAPVRELVETLREVGAGSSRLTELPLRLRSRAAERLAPADRAILAMRLAGTARADIAKVAGLHLSDLHGRLAAIAAQLAGQSTPDTGGRLRAVA